MTSPIIAKAFINNEGDYLKECSICFRVEEQMLQCSGACQSYYCNTCISKRRILQCNEYSDICCKYIPLRLVKNDKIKYYCPYNREICKQQIKSSEQFWKHCEECPYITFLGKEEMKNKKEYRCRFGHRLIFVTAQNFHQIYSRGSHYFTTNSETCSYCLQDFLSKSVCLKCGVANRKGIYCILCRPIPCQQSSCPIGHEFKIQKNFGDQNICDYCGRPSKTSGKVIYGDRQCNYDICQSCYERIPEKNDLIPIDNSF